MTEIRKVAVVKRETLKDDKLVKALKKISKIISKSKEDVFVPMKESFMDHDSAKNLIKELMKYPAGSEEFDLVMDIERAQTATLDGEDLPIVL